MKLKRVFSVHTTASLRKELHDPKTNKWMRNAIYGELLRRKRGKK